MLTLKPIGITSQIEDAINGRVHPNADKKLRFVRANIGRLTHVNGARAYRPSTDGESVYYYLRPASRTEYYYPIQYARLTFAR